MKVRSFPLLILALVMALVGAQPAQADLQARGPVSALNGYPTWYQDFNSLALTLCLDQTPVTPNGPTACALPPEFDPDPAAAPLRTPPNSPLLTITPDKNITPIGDTTFPVESFYFMASTGGQVSSPTGVISLTLYEAAIEGGFAGAVVDTGQAAFSRIRIRADVTVPGTYTVTHPYGVQTFNVAAIVGGPEINETIDVPGLVAAQFDVPVTPGLAFPSPPFLFVGPTFLTNANGTFFTHPVTGDKYIGDFATPVAVQGGLNGINSVTIQGGGETLTADTFVLMGKMVGMEITPPATGNDFGTVKPDAVPATPVTKTFNVNNLTGIAFTPVFTATVPGTADLSPDFTAVPSTTSLTPCPIAPATLAAGTNCDFDVTFAPAAPPAGADGLKTATITISDATGAVPPARATVTGTSDATGPTQAITEPLNGNFTKINTPLLTFTATDVTNPVVNVVKVDNVIVATLSGENLALLADGQHTVTVESTDAVGNLSTATSTFTVDTIAPAVSVTVPAANGFTKLSTPLTFTANDTNAVNNTVTLDGTPVTPTPDTLIGLTDGQHAVTVQSTDAAGNVTTVTNTFTADGIAPAIDITSPAIKLATPTATAGTIGITSPLLTFPVTDVNADPTQTTVTLDGTPLVNPVSGVTTLGPFTVGTTHTLVISATDLAGNVTTTTKNFSLLLADGAMTTLGASAPTIADVLKALRVVAQLDTLAPTSDTFKHGDVAPLVNGVPQPDGEITIGDVLLILRKVAELINF